MVDISERIRHQASMDKIMTADEAAQLFQDGMLVATSGSVMGYPKATLIALAERIKKGGGIKIDLLCTGPLSPEVEDVLAETGGIRTRIGAIGSEKLRSAVNRGEVKFIEGKGSQLPQQVRRGWFRPIDILVIEAIGLTPEGNILPSTAVYDTPEWIDAARQVIVEINLNRPLGLEGLHDVYRKSTDPIPLSLSDALKRVGVPYFSIDPKKIRGVVLSDRGDKASDEGKPDPKGDLIGDHLIDFFRSEIAAGRMSDPLPPLEVGIGGVVGAFLKKIGDSEFSHLRFHMPTIADPVLDIIDRGKVDWVSGMTLRFTSEGWKRFGENIDRYKQCMVLRPVTICNSAEIIQRFGVIGINGCLEMDIQGQVNSSHVLGSRVLSGIAGSYDFSRNGLYSIFIGSSTARGGAVSSIVPMVSHVDHTEHDVDILVTEQGLADLRGLDPLERAETIIRQCAHPDFKKLLSDYLAEAKKEPGHIPFSLEKAYSFHLRLKRSGSMKEPQ